MFNDYMWQIYLNAGGKSVVENFRCIEQDEFLKNETKKYCDFIKKLNEQYCPSQTIVNMNYDQLSLLFSDVLEGDLLYGCYGLVGLSDEKKYSSFELTTLLVNELVTVESNEKKAFEEFSAGISYYSVFCHIMFPEYFIPYFFKYNFNILEKIAQEFEIELPPVPLKKDYKGRLYYYGEICDTLYEFREKHNMSPYELCAFLYDFAPKYIGGIDSYIIKNLPEPQSAFFIGGSKDDCFFEDETDVVTCWQCNPDTRAGDMIVMYLRAPISAVDSVWRSVSVGFNDPFFYYYRCTYIANPVGIKRITQKQLMKDEIFKELSIVKKNMQGINGVELLPSEYNHLMDMAESDAPRLKFIVSDTNQIFCREKDVEHKLIIPLIEKLGYGENDYVRQMYIEIGNHNHMIIPDFVIMPKCANGHNSAFAIIEAKLFIPNSKEMLAVKMQARSYAVQLKAQYSCIADKNRIWIYIPDDDYEEEIFSASWEELNDADVFSNLLKILGKKRKLF